MSSSPKVVVQRRIPTYDVVIRTSCSPSVVRNHIEQVFARGLEKPRGFVLFDNRFWGRFEGETSFSVVSYSKALHGSVQPVIEGYFIPNDESGSDILVRAEYPPAWWILDLLILVLVAISTFTSGNLFDVFLAVPAAAGMLAAISFLMLWIEGRSFVEELRTGLMS